MIEEIVRDYEPARKGSFDYYDGEDGIGQSYESMKPEHYPSWDLIRPVFCNAFKKFNENCKTNRNTDVQDFFSAAYMAMRMVFFTGDTKEEIRRKDIRLKEGHDCLVQSIRACLKTVINREVNKIWGKCNISGIDVDGIEDDTIPLYNQNDGFSMLEEIASVLTPLQMDIFNIEKENYAYVDRKVVRTRSPNVNYTDKEMADMVGGGITIEEVKREKRNLINQLRKHENRFFNS